MRRRYTLLSIVVLVIVVLTMMAAPALAAPNPPAAAQFGLHTAHCATMGTPGHTKVPYVCPMPMEDCAGMMGM